MEDHRWFISLLETKLQKNIDYHSEGAEKYNSSKATYDIHWWYASRICRHVFSGTLSSLVSKNLKSEIESLASTIKGQRIDRLSRPKHQKLLRVRLFSRTVGLSLASYIPR